MADNRHSGPALARQCDITRHNNYIARKTRICEQCGVSFIEGKRSSKQVAAGYVQKYCSRTCSADSKRVYASEKESLAAYNARYLERHGDDCAACGSKFLSKAGKLHCAECIRVIASSKVAAAREARCKPRECRGCGVLFVPSRGNQRFHSSECTIATNKRINRARYRNAKRIGGYGLDPFKVFERDGWKCHLCGVKTMKSKRGTDHPKAPELDHILPISKGGAHTYANTACSCRACNRTKRDKPMGQMLLFG